jgi:ABC-2 type transport system permease protein
MPQPGRIVSASDRQGAEGLMLRLLTTLHKELLLLRRDWVGLLVLFVMPAVLVVVITLVQDNAMQALGQSATEVLLVNDDGQAVGNRIETALEAVAGIKLVKSIRGRPADRSAALAAVAHGDFQVGLIIAAETTPAVRAAARRWAVAALSAQHQAASDGHGNARLELHFDPTVLGAVRSAVKSQMQLLLLKIEVAEKMTALSDLLPPGPLTTRQEALGPDPALEADTRSQGHWDPQPLLAVDEDTALSEGNDPIPNAVQQNVPAWSLFGIFFIVLPMAGSFIKERRCGVQRRMLSMPVVYLTVAVGKVGAYMLVCCVQIGLILAIGRWLLPLMGTPAFQIGPVPTATLAVALSAIAAATGYGILLGTAIETYEQASMFGPISVVIAAALGGIMVPVYAMPPLMRQLSLLSPLGWAQQAFLDLFIRGGGLGAVDGSIYKLLAFAAACIAAACFLFIRKRRQGKI